MVDEEDLKTELGRRLRAARAAQGRTLAAVAIDAGLSVPYVANLESARGNPTLSALHALAAALGVTLCDLLDSDRAVTPTPAALAQFTHGSRFRAEAARLATEIGERAKDTRGRLGTAMTGVAQYSPRPLDDLDYQRLLDTLVVVFRPRA